MSTAIAIVAILVAAYAFWQVRTLKRSMPPPDARKAWEDAVRKALQ
ncbi:MAG TPA: hypothetical protein VFP92_10920 [Rhodanobacteraceae bacterium]|nr:hypothetical protein [Rhodanobacteraceae bacterium]